MSGMSANLCASRAFFNCGKSKKLQRAKVTIFVMGFLVRNSQRIMHRGIVMMDNPLVRPEIGSFPPKRFL
jgi:hypothetical protein